MTDSHPNASYYAQRHKQHEAGWHIFLDDECIAELDYIHDEQPYHLFRFTSHTEDQRKIDYALRSTARRDPDSRIEFRNRLLSIGVPDGPFLANLHEAATVYIRDFRLPDDPIRDEPNA